jgi:hypothetical protein
MAKTFNAQRGIGVTGVERFPEICSARTVASPREIDSGELEC